MITQKLKIIFGISVPFFILHGIEEFLTHFYDKDAHSQAIFGMFSSLSNHGATFAVFQIMFWLLLIVALLLIMGGRWQLYTLGVAGLVYLYELHHVYGAIASGGYYPGLYTSIAFPVIGFFFWKEWLTVKKQNI